MPSQEHTSLTVFLTMPRRGLVQSTDRDYIYLRFTRLGERYPLRFIGNDSFLFLARWTAKHILHRATRGFAFNSHSVLEHLRISPDANVVFSYGIFPVDARSRTPIVWEQTFAPTSRETREDDWIQTLRRARSRAIARTTSIVTATQTSVDWCRRIFPEARDRVYRVPYYLPDLEPTSQTMTGEKFQEEGPLRVLFVGKQGHRKGLDVLVDAYEALPREAQAELDVTVVSKMLDGPIALPQSFHAHSTVPDVFSLMRSSHVLVFPTKQEAFGLVLVEAMASGCAVITTKAPIQRDIVGEDGGLFVDPKSAGELTEALKTLLRDRPRCARMAKANLSRFASVWHHSVVGEQYATLLRAAAGGRGPSSTTRL